MYSIGSLLPLFSTGPDTDERIITSVDARDHRMIKALAKSLKQEMKCFVIIRQEISSGFGKIAEQHTEGEKLAPSEANRGNY